MPRTPQTASFKLNHTLLRIKDPKVSLPFYLNVLGMDILTEFPSGDYYVYYLGYDCHDLRNLPTKERYKAIFSREGVLELAYNTNPSTDFGDDFHSDNTGEIQGYTRHIGLTVDDVDAVCARFEQLHVSFERRLNEAFPKNVAFIFDPDGHSIEIVPRNFLPKEST